MIIVVNFATSNIHKRNMGGLFFNQGNSTVHITAISSDALADKQSVFRIN
jgi:hypothetical protein